MDEELPEYVSAAVAARVRGVTLESVGYNIRKGKLQAIRIGRNWAIRRDTLLEFASDYVKGPGPQKKR